MLSVNEVWGYNFEWAMSHLAMKFTQFHVVSVDAEYPGCIRQTPKLASALVRYADMKFNIDSTKLLQLGLTLSDENGNVGGCWEFNFCNFDESEDACSRDSVEFLKVNGLDLEKMRKEGLDVFHFTAEFVKIFGRHRNLKWVSFHGLYDFGYLLQSVTRRFLPNYLTEFSQIMGSVFGQVYDLKVMASNYKELVCGEVGLEKLGELLKVGRSGLAHHAGSDSLLTAQCFTRMKQNFCIDDRLYKGFLYGIDVRIVRPKLIVPVFVVPCYRPPYPIPIPMFAPPSRPVFFGL